VNAATTLALEVRDLAVAYGKVEALHHASLRVGRGSIVTVIGPNGAGKTTMLCALMGLLPSTGGIAYLGAPLEGVEVEERVERGLCLVPERRELFGEMTVEDNLRLGAFPRYRRRESGIAAGSSHPLSAATPLFDEAGAWKTRPITRFRRLRDWLGVRDDFRNWLITAA